jgi:hypothetical protein
MSGITARFYVASTRKFAGQTQEGWAAPAPRIEVELNVVSANKPGNAEWASATPSGKLIMTVGNPEAAVWFEEMLGQDVELIIRPRSEAETQG